MKTSTVPLTCLFLISFSVISWSIPCRVDLIPNGDKFSCTNCHTEDLMKRNVFGKMVEGYVDVGSCEPFWGPEIARGDVDGDGLSNGEELQDPEGTWKEGEPSPGNRDEVTLPGSADVVEKPKAFHRHQLVVPFGYTTLSLMILTVLAGLFRKKKPKLLLKWHKRLAFTTLTIAIVHATLAILFY